MTDTNGRELIALDIKTRKCKLLIEDGELLSGVMENTVASEESFRVPRKYRARILISKKIDKNDLVENVVVK